MRWSAGRKGPAPFALLPPAPERHFNVWSRTREKNALSYRVIGYEVGETGLTQGSPGATVAVLRRRPKSLTARV